MTPSVCVVCEAKTGQYFSAVVSGDVSKVGTFLRHILDPLRFPSVSPLMINYLSLLRRRRRPRAFYF